MPNGFPEPAQLAWIWLILLLTLCRPSAQCHPGCLSCSDSAECLLCDSLNFFYFDETDSACVQTKREHCLYSENRDECSFCAEGRFWDSASQKCEELEPSLRTRHCRSHNEAKECVLCEAEYRLSEGKCVFDFQQVAHCSDFDWEASLCRACLPGFRLWADQSLCASLAEQKCLVADAFECTGCARNYFPRKADFYSEVGSRVLEWGSAVLFSSVSADFSQKLFEKHASTLASREEFACEKSSLSHCKSLATASVCAECEDMFVLDAASRQCESRILPQVPHCAEYSGFGACAKCEEGFFKESNSSCLRPLETDFCLEYAQAFDGCLRCKDGYRLSELKAGNSCLARNHFPIANCGTFIFPLTGRRVPLYRRPVSQVRRRVSFYARRAHLPQRNCKLQAVWPPRRCSRPSEVPRVRAIPFPGLGGVLRGAHRDLRLRRVLENLGPVRPVPRAVPFA